MMLLLVWCLFTIALKKLYYTIFEFIKWLLNAYRYHVDKYGVQCPVPYPCSVQCSGASEGMWHLIPCRADFIETAQIHPHNYIEITLCTSRYYSSFNEGTQIRINCNRIEQALSPYVINNKFINKNKNLIETDALKFFCEG